KSLVGRPDDLVSSQPGGLAVGLASQSYRATRSSGWSAVLRAGEHRNNWWRTVDVAGRRHRSLRQWSGSDGDGFDWCPVSLDVGSPPSNGTGALSSVSGSMLSTLLR